jgi:hypothetical protein
MEKDSELQHDVLAELEWEACIRLEETGSHIFSARWLL